jgi:ribosome-dependent ATPase
MRARRRGLSVIVCTACIEETERFDWLPAMDDGGVIDTAKA